MRIIVIGSRLFRDKELVRDSIRQAWIDLGKPALVTIVHTGAPGPEAEASILADKMGFTLEIHDKNWENGSLAASIRNQEIIKLGADLCLIFIRNNPPALLNFSEQVKSSGIPVRIFSE